MIFVRYREGTDTKSELEHLGGTTAPLSGFAGRQALYERYFAGDPWRLGALTAQHYPRQGEFKARVSDFLQRTKELHDAQSTELEQN